MTITEYYKNYKNNKHYPHTLSNGSASSIGEFYNKCIAPNLLPIENVLAWHEMLLEYVERKDAVLWIRYHESGNKNNGRWNNRRACKTEFEDGFSYVFVSNFDVHEIFNMVHLGVEPDAEEFAALMNTHKFHLHYDSGKSCEESDICSYPIIGSTRAGVLTVGHWYLAHIIGIKSDYYDHNGKTIPVDVERLYPRGDVSDWAANSDGFKVRKLNYSLSKQEKELVKAHFLRFVDPLNYYLVPGKYFQVNNINKQIGEAAMMNDYVSNMFANEYGAQTMQKFRKLVLAPHDLLQISGNKAITIEYGPKVENRKNASQISTEQMLTAAAFFMRGKPSLIKVEEQILQLFNKRGWAAKKILENLGITNDKKGLLINADIDSEIARATGVFKETLEEIKKLGL